MGWITQHWCVEPLAILIACYFFAGSPPPSVNEAHYLAKAKHYWQPSWCAGDFFLESADAHEVFFWTFGWVTNYLSLPATAWAGRVLVWGLFAFSWCKLVRVLCNQRYAAIVSAVVLLPLTYYGHLAGEWLIGGIEAKGFAYPFVFLAFAKAVEGKWWAVWPLLGLASSFHILVGGWAVVACLFALLWLRQQGEEETIEFMPLLFWLTIGGLFSLPGLWPALKLTAEATAEEIREANITYTFRRLSHHLVPYRFAQWNPFAPGFTVLRPLSFGVVCFLWLRFYGIVGSPRWRRFCAIVGGSLLIACVGLVVDVITSPFDHFQLWPLANARASLLRFYWFRMSDMMVPVGLALLVVVHWSHSVGDRSGRKRMPLFTGVVFTVSLFALLYVSTDYGYAARSMSLQQQNWRGPISDVDPERVDEDWRDVCEWVRMELPQESVVLTPVPQQTFKWYAQRPEVVTWKDVPQNAPSLVAWWERRRQVHKLGLWPWEDEEQLANVVGAYGVTHIVWPDVASTEYGTGATQIYRNELFRIFEVTGTIPAQEVKTDGL